MNLSSTSVTLLLDDLENCSKLHCDQAVIDRAIDVQSRLSSHVDQTRASLKPFGESLCAGVDVAYHEESDMMIACACLIRAETFEIVDHVSIFRRVPFPYIPGLFSLREAPIAMEAISALSQTPDVILIDGHGTAHVRRFGLACHVGLRLGIPTVGVAKNPHCRDLDFSTLGAEKGSYLELFDDVGNIMGCALRTKSGVKPLFVSVGSGLSLEQARAAVLSMCRDFRQPETTRFTDHEVRVLSKRYVGGGRAP